ncbi:hypothetical protein KC909_06450, partial [Candidatus Dojkabacteria bacterium]|nr:hypothetical protein [Candidatus Dojkabacteria bacterium]
MFSFVFAAIAVLLSAFEIFILFIPDIYIFGHGFIGLIGLLILLFLQSIFIVTYVLIYTSKLKLRLIWILALQNILNGILFVLLMINLIIV